MKENCSFENGKCTVECKKYPMCSYTSLQKQMCELQEQVSFIYNFLKNLNEKIENNKLCIKELDEKLMTFTADLLDLYNESEAKKESN